MHSTDENYIYDDINLDLDQEQQQDKYNINSFRTFHLTFTLIGNSMKLPRHMINNNPIALPKHNIFKTLDEVGPEDSE